MKEKPYLTVSEIKRIVGEHYGVTIAQIDSPKRERFVVFPRFVAYWFSVHLLRLSYIETGRRFYRDHGSIINGCRAINDQLSIDRKLKSSMERLWEKLKAAGRVEIRTQMELDELLSLPTENGHKLLAPGLH